MSFSRFSFLSFIRLGFAAVTETGAVVVVTARSPSIVAVYSFSFPFFADASNLYIFNACLSVIICLAFLFFYFDVIQNE